MFIIVRLDKRMKDKLSMLVDDATATHKKAKRRRRIRRVLRRLVKENQEGAVLMPKEEGKMELEPA